MEKQKLVLGLAPTRRDTRDFPLHFAHKRKAEVEAMVRDIAATYRVEVVNIDFLNDEGLLIYPEDAPKVAAHFQEYHVDAVMVPHVNFGAEEAVAILGKLVGKPLLLWGPRDEAPPPSGPRQTDTQCGLFATGMVLNRYRVPFTYLENCWLDDKKFSDGLIRFFRTASVVKAFRGLRIGQISVRPRTFLTVKVNENQLLERFGIEIVTIDYTEMAAEIQRMLREKPTSMREIQAALLQNYDTAQMEPEAVEKLATMEAAILGLAEKYGLTCLASECWRTFSVPFGIMPCAGFADLTERGLPVACECDIHGAISSCLLAAASQWEQATFLADMTIRHPTNDNAELLWHCGPCPVSMSKQGSVPRMEQCLGQFPLERGDVTVCRFGETEGEYKLFIGEGRSVEGPETNGNYLWLETCDWPQWEEKLVKGPYIHHISVAFGTWGSVLREACGYLGIAADMAP